MSEHGSTRLHSYSLRSSSSSSPHPLNSEASILLVWEYVLGITCCTQAQKKENPRAEEKSECRSRVSTVSTRRRAEETRQQNIWVQEHNLSTSRVNPGTRKGCKLTDHSLFMVYIIVYSYHSGVFLVLSFGQTASPGLQPSLLVP